MNGSIQQQKICVTGGQGALGRRLVKELLDRGAKEVVVFDQRMNACQVNTGLPIRYVAGDILKPGDLESALRDCTIVFHLAALTHVGNSAIKPMKYWEVNCLGTAQVLEMCRMLDIKRVVYASTGHVYGAPFQCPISEDHPTNPRSIYAASKLAGEAVLQGYAADYELCGVIARLSNLYGGGLGPATVIGLALEQTATGRPLEVRNMESIRDFTYIDDAAEALVRLATVETAPAECRIVNVTNGLGVSVAKMIEALITVAKSLGMERLEVKSATSPDSEKVPTLILDNHRIKDLLGWTPSISLERGLTMALKEYIS